MNVVAHLAHGRQATSFLLGAICCEGANLSRLVAAVQCSFYLTREEATRRCDQFPHGFGYTFRFSGVTTCGGVRGLQKGTHHGFQRYGGTGQAKLTQVLRVQGSALRQDL